LFCAKLHSIKAGSSPTPCHYARPVSPHIVIPSALFTHLCHSERLVSGARNLLRSPLRSLASPPPCLTTHCHSERLVYPPLSFRAPCFWREESASIATTLSRDPVHPRPRKFLDNPAIDHSHPAPAELLDDAVMRDGLADHEVTNSRPDARAGQCIAGKAEFQPAAQSTRRKRQQIRAGSKGQWHLAESVASPLLQLRVLGFGLFRDGHVRVGVFYKGAVRIQKSSSMMTLLSYRLNPNARYLPSRDGRGSKSHAGPTGPLSIVFTLPSRLTEAIWNVSPTEPET